MVWMFSLTNRNVILMKSYEWHSMCVQHDPRELHAISLTSSITLCLLFSFIDCCGWLWFALISLHALLTSVIDRRQTSSTLIWTVNVDRHRTGVHFSLKWFAIETLRAKKNQTDSTGVLVVLCSHTFYFSFQKLFVRLSKIPTSHSLLLRWYFSFLFWRCQLMIAV